RGNGGIPTPTRPGTPPHEARNRRPPHRRAYFGGITLWGGDDPIEPQRSQVREAFRFRRAIVDPLYPVCAGCDAGYHRLPVDEVVTVLNRVNLTGNCREFDQHRSVSQMHDAVDGDRRPVRLSGRGDRHGFGAQSGPGRTPVGHVVFDGQQRNFTGRKGFTVLNEGDTILVARAVVNLDTCPQTTERYSDGGESGPG